VFELKQGANQWFKLGTGTSLELRDCSSNAFTSHNRFKGEKNGVM